MCAVSAIYHSAVKERTPHLDLQFCLCARNWQVFAPLFLHRNAFNSCIGCILNVSHLIIPFHLQTLSLYNFLLLWHMRVASFSRGISPSYSSVRVGRIMPA